MVDQIPLHSPERYSQSSPPFFNNPKEARDFLLPRNTFLDPTKPPETLKIQEHKINKVRQTTPQDKIRRTFTLDSHYICSISGENSILIKSNENIMLPCAIENIPSTVLDLCLYEGAGFSLLAIICKDGTISGYKIELNESKNSISIHHFLTHRIEGEIQYPQIVWKDMCKLGVNLGTELILIEVIQPEYKEGQPLSEPSKPRSFNTLRCDKAIRDICFSPRYALAYLLLEDNTIRVINVENGFTIREFVPHNSRVIRMLVYKNLAKATPANSGPPQVVKFSKDHDYSLKDVFITITEDFEVKIWDLSEWDNENKTYYCLEGMLLKQNFAKAQPESIIQTFFDLKRQFLFITCSQNDNKETSVVAIQINDFFQKFQENYTTAKKQTKFCGCVTKILLQKPNIINISALTAYDSARVHQPKESTEAQRTPSSDSNDITELNIEPLFSFVVEADKYLTLLYVLRERLPQISSPPQLDTQLENDLSLHQKDYIRYSFSGQQRDVRINLASLYKNNSDKPSQQWDLNLGGLNRNREFDSKGMSLNFGMGMGIESKLESLIESHVQKAFEKYITNFEEVIERKISEKILEFRVEIPKQKSIDELSEVKEGSASSDPQLEHYSNKILQKVERMLEGERIRNLAQLRLQEEQQLKLKDTVNQNLNSFSQLIAVLTQVVTKNQNSIIQLENTIQSETVERNGLVTQVRQLIDRDKEFYAKIQDLEKCIQEVRNQSPYRPESSPNLTSNLDPTYQRLLQQVSAGKSSREPYLSEGYRKAMQEICNSLLRINRLGLNISRPSGPESDRPVSATHLDVPKPVLLEKPLSVINEGNPLPHYISRARSLPTDTAPEIINNPVLTVPTMPIQQNYEYYSPYGFNNESKLPQSFAASPIIEQQATFIQQNPTIRNSPLQSYPLGHAFSENPVSRRVSLSQTIQEHNSGALGENQLLSVMNERSPVNANKSFTGSEGLCIQNVFAFPTGVEQGQFGIVSGDDDEEQQEDRTNENVGLPPGLSWGNEGEDNTESLLPKNLLQ